MGGSGGQGGHAEHGGGISTGTVDPAAAGVRIEWASEPASAQPGQPVSLRYKIVDTKSGQAVTNLAVSHERPMHLIVVSKDLAQFQHVHPEPGADGAYSVTVTLPNAGPYVLYDEFERDGKTVLDRRELVVGSGGPTSASLAPDLVAKNDAGLNIALTAPATLKAGEEARFVFTVTRDGVPVTDLAPYLGAAAHVAIASADTTAFVHTHGEAGTHSHGSAGAEAPAAAFGPEVSFEHTFAKPGFYKIWGQFNQGGRVITTSYVVEVR